MKSIPNGSLLSNVLLVTGGALAGAAVTWTLTPKSADTASVQGLAFSFSKNSASGRGAPPAPHQTGDLPLKLQQILAADDPTHKGTDLNRLGREAGARDARAALILADEIDHPPDRLDFLRGTFETWAGQDPQAAASYASTQFPAGQLRSEAVRLSVGKWAETDARAAFEWMEANLSGPLKEESLIALAQGWSRRAPEQAAAWFVQTGSTSQPLLTAIANTWARHDPGAAVQWASQLQDPASRAVGLTSAFSEMARHDPAAAAAAAEPFLATNSSAAAAVPELPLVLADIWGTTDPAATAAWIRQLSPGPSQLEAAQTLATVWAASDIHAAIEWTATLADPTVKSAVITHLGTTWGAMEPDRALAWLDTLPADLAARGTTGALNSWAATDPVGLQDWITQLPPGPRNDLARRSLADVLVSRDPLNALQLAADISDPVQQNDLVARYYRQFHRSDAASATEWLSTEASRLPAQAQQSLARENQRLRQQTQRAGG